MRAGDYTVLGEVRSFPLSLRERGGGEGGFLFCSRFARSSCVRSYGAVLAPRASYFSLCGQRKVTQRKAAPDGATPPVSHPILGPALPRRGILPREAVARIPACAPFGALSQN